VRCESLSVQIEPDLILFVIIYTATYGISPEKCLF